MNRCSLCDRYVREHLERQGRAGRKVFDRHTVLPFDREWCQGSNRTMEDTERLRQQRKAQADA